ncbi:hypothetical protein HMPREF1531_00658 [Propionibacterium sp. oral taxon 192 str. F0372]|uniref:ABC transporter permease n=1 Tax=Propionibacterium sp. oral taxon 192 TaxID=671222 RepID=UPI00035300B4|nr:ABC transporter permease [Propionibacterium sp. oral taxon 192]EPH06010.1 hypothetical protein HMPREF1531_00658 [Propionibacterium sp. oral taxon 192 str. F0372]
MLSIFRVQLLRLARGKTMLIWALGLPMALSVIFVTQFGNFTTAFQPRPMPLGLVADQTSTSAPELDRLVEELGDENSDIHYATFTVHSSAQEAEEAALRGDTDGYLRVNDGTPDLHLTPKGNTSATSLVLRAVLDSYVQTVAEQQAIMSSSADPGAAIVLQTRQTFTQRLQVTPTPPDPAIRNYFALLAFASGMGMLIAISGIQAVMGTVSALGARSTMAGVPRWRVLLGTLAASWVAILACMLITYAFLVLVGHINFGPRSLLCLVVIGLSSLMSCTAGTLIGTTRGPAVTMASAISCLLSLFSGLYGPASQSLADNVERTAPLLSHVNPLWQTTNAYNALVHHSSLSSFIYSCGVLALMAVLFLAVAAIRMRRMGHAHL